jgi:hypothetical protein
MVQVVSGVNRSYPVAMPLEEILEPRPHRRFLIAGDDGKDLEVVVAPENQAYCFHAFYDGAPVAHTGVLRIVDLDALIPWNICAACATLAGVKPKPAK